MNYVATRDEFEHYANRLFEMMAQNQLKTSIHDTYPLKDVARAHNVGLRDDLLAKDITDSCARISRVGRPWANCS